MSKESFLSREVFLTNLPSVPRVRAKFQYNFFTPNESTTLAERQGSKSIEPRPVDTATADANAATRTNTAAAAAAAATSISTTDDRIRWANATYVSTSWAESWRGSPYKIERRYG